MADHRTDLAARAAHEVDASESCELCPPIGIVKGQAWDRVIFRDGGIDVEKRSGTFEGGGNLCWREQTVVADLDEARRKHVLEKATDEFVRGQRRGIATACNEAHAVAVDRLDALVGDGHAMCVSTEILKDVIGTGEGFLGVDDPRLSVQRVDKAVERWIVA